MKIGIPVLLVSAFALPGQENGDLETWMKSAGASLGVLRKLEKKTGPEAVANAEKLGGIYENMIGFWRQRNAEDAVKLSAEGKAAAVELASAANADDAEKAAAAFNRIGGTCKACHDAHREKTPEGKYKIK